MVDKCGTDEKLILQILDSIPTDRRILAADVHGATPDILNDLQKFGLIDYDWSMEIRNHGYRRTAAGNDWIRNYHYQNRQETLTWAGLGLMALAALFAAVAAYPQFRELAIWLLFP